MTDQQQQRAQELHDQGWGYKRIAAELGVSHTTVRRWVKPGFAERQREMSREAKRRRTGTCRVCGGVTRYNGHNGVSVSPICGPCSIEEQTFPEWAFEHLFDLYLRGLSCYEIAERLGSPVPGNYITMFLKNRGFELRPKGDALRLYWERHPEQRIKQGRLIREGIRRARAAA